MSRLRVCFLGTPDFALVSLKRILEDDHYEVVGVVSQPDRPSGRKLALTPSPVKKYALEKGLTVITPEKVKDALDEIATWRAEVAIVVAYGQILSTKFLELFPFGAVNVHGSILPRWRGAAPIQRALEAGDLESGVALQKIVRELDAGDVLGIRSLKLDSEINAKELHDQLAVLGADLLHLELMDYLRGNLVPTPQDPSGVTIAKKIDKSEALIDWSQPAVQIHNKVRAFTMGPGTYTLFQGKKLKVLRTRSHSEKGSGKPGEIVQIDEASLRVATSQGTLEIFEVQPESRNRSQTQEFVRGYSVKKGDLFGV